MGIFVIGEAGFAAQVWSSCYRRDHWCRQFQAFQTGVGRQEMAGGILQGKPEH